MTRALGTTGLQLTELGFGGGAIGGLYAAVSRDAAMEAMQAAWDVGMRYFDTAPFYGFGLSERRVGDFLRDKSGYVLSTKVAVPSRTFALMNGVCHCSSRGQRCAS